MAVDSCDSQTALFKSFLRQSPGLGKYWLGAPLAGWRAAFTLPLEIWLGRVADSHLEFSFVCSLDSLLTGDRKVVGQRISQASSVLTGAPQQMHAEFFASVT